MQITNRKREQRLLYRALLRTLEEFCNANKTAEFRVIEYGSGKVGLRLLGDKYIPLLPFRRFKRILYVSYLRIWRMSLLGGQIFEVE